ncbi:MAG: hypothetical protein ACOCXG_04095, partial [Nanoarchaeota archaeon]
MIRKVLVLVLIFGMFGLAFANPSISLDSTTYNNGPLDLSGMATSGSKLTLTVNDYFVSSQTVVAPQIEYNLSSGINDIEVPVGTNLLFRNDGAQEVSLNLSDDAPNFLIFGISYKDLQPGETLMVAFQSPTTLDYEDEATGNSAEIRVIEKQVPFVFEDVEQDFLVNGQNDFKIQVEYWTPTFLQDFEESYVISYTKYPVSITLQNYTNVTNKREVFVPGYFSGSSNVELRYLVNAQRILDAGAGVLIDNVSGGNFGAKLAGLTQGTNQIIIYSVDKDSGFVNGEVRFEVEVDIYPPEIKFDYVIINSSSLGYAYPAVSGEKGYYSNNGQLTIKIDVDAVELLVTDRKENLTQEYVVVNDTVTIKIDLDDGENPYDFEAIDLAGNSVKVAHNFFFSDEEPKLIRDESEPKDFFKGGATTHFPIQKIDGKVTVPNSKVTLVALSDSDREVVSCQEFVDRFNMEKQEALLNNERNQNEVLREWESSSPTFLDIVDEIRRDLGDLDFLSAIDQEEIEVNNEGEFEAVVVLVEDEVDEVLTNPDVKSRNELCFFIEDPFGNLGLDTLSVTLDLGNSCWDVQEVTVTPNTIYSAEITQAQNSPIGNDGLEISVFASFRYVCGGDVTDLRAFSVSPDYKKYDSSRVGSISNENTRAMISPEDPNELLAYFPVEIKRVPEGISDKPTQYDSWEDFWQEAEELKLAFAAHITYSANGNDVLVDTRNPIYFEGVVNVENPYDHSKWLTPEKVDDAIGFLNDTIEFTEDAVDWTQKGVYAGMAWCTLERLKFATSQQTPEDYHELFLACDRVACLPTPQKCDGNGFENLDPGQNGVLALENGRVTDLERETNGHIYGGGENGEKGSLVAQFDSLSVGSYCEYGKDSNGNPIHGVLVSGSVTQYEEESVGLWKQTSETGEYRFNQKCVPANYGEGQFDNGKLNAGERPSSINVQAASGVCYTEGPDRFDETKCWLPGVEGGAGYDPSDNILESIRCGCITKTYSHLKNLLKLQKDIRACLESVKTGELKGSYCERLLATAVCDIATNVVFKTLTTSPDKDFDKGIDRSKDLYSGVVEGMRDGDKALNDRYKGTWFSQAGLGTEQLANKVCLGAVTGDWSAFTEGLLSEIEEDQIEPTFLPPFPESRFMGYDPLTGRLSIMYRFTHGVISGGSVVRTK